MLRKMSAWAWVAACGIALTGCGGPPEQSDTAVHVQAPGVDVKAGPGGTQVNAPGVDVNAGAGGADVQAPGVDVKTRP
jgi:hypothetical protein